MLRQNSGRVHHQDPIPDQRNRQIDAQIARAPYRTWLVRWLPWIVGLIALFGYGRTAAPGIVTFFDDSLEFQTVAPTFGIAHPTGYPLYTLLGGIWTHLLPFGAWAGRMNLLSALFAAVAIGMLVAVGSRLAATPAGRPNPWAGLAAATVFALGPVWWSQATVAEVYALHSLFIVALLQVTLLTAALAHSHAAGHHALPVVETTAFHRRMLLLCTLFGLGMTHHRTILLLAPPLLLFLVWHIPNFWRPRRRWWAWAAALILPTLLYLYLPLRASMGSIDLQGSYVNSWTGFWDHVLARGYTSFFAANPLAADYTPGDWLMIVRRQTGWLGFLLAFAGAVWLRDRRPHLARTWVLVGFILLINLIFTLNYKVPDPEVFLLPVILCISLLAGGGVSLLEYLPVPAHNIAMQAMLRSGQTFLVALLILLPMGRGDIVDRSRAWRAHDQARLMANVDFAPNSVIIGLVGEITALRYMQAAEGLARDADLVAVDDPAQRREMVARQVAAERPVYLTRELEGIGATYSFSSAGALVRVWPRGAAPLTLPADTTPLDLGDSPARIVGYNTRRTEITADPYLELALYWRAAQQTEQTLKVSLRVLTEDGSPLTWPDGAPVVADRYPLHQVASTADWPPGELVQDTHHVQLPASAAGQPLRLRIIMYDSETVREVGHTEIMF